MPLSGAPLSEARRPSGAPLDGSDRTAEWYVPSFGPLMFRRLVGMLFLPYTGMVLSFTVIGAMMAERVWWDRVGAIGAIYFLALGIGAHALDAVGSKGRKPWGPVLAPPVLWLIALTSVAAAYVIAAYYVVQAAPWLSLIALTEGFFLFAYNLEWFDGRFHTDAWFAVSWGALPVLAGYVIQTNAVSLSAIVMAAAMGLLSLVEITASRPYKELRREPHGGQSAREAARPFEAILKSISLGVILLALGLLLLRWTEPVSSR